MNAVGNTPAILLHITTSWNNSGSDVPTQLSGFIHNFLTRLKRIHTEQIHRQRSGVTADGLLVGSAGSTTKHNTHYFDLKVVKEHKVISPETTEPLRGRSSEFILITSASTVQSFYDLDISVSNDQ